MTSEPVTRKAGGRFTGPRLPSRVILDLGGILIEHYYRGGGGIGNHGPPHAHVSGQGNRTRIGQNGHPLEGDPPLSPAQARIVMKNRAVIRKVLRKIGRWHWFNEL